MSWIDEEFKDVDFGDKRLNQRFLDTSNLLADRPELSINNAIEDFDSKKAAYRLFSNIRCTSQKIFQPHVDNTIKRWSKHNVIFSIHEL